MTHHSRLACFYEVYLRDHNTNQFIDAVIQFYNEAALIRLTTSYQPLSRRAAALALGFMGSYEANAALGSLLHDDDSQVALIAESSIKNVWSRAGTPSQRSELRAIMREIANANYAEAVRLANNLLEEQPRFSEARNQRAIALFALRQYEDAIRDCIVVLEENPFHFGAAVGMGHAYLQLGEHGIALGAFHYALHINPQLAQIQKQVAMIEQQIIDEA